MAAAATPDLSEVGTAAEKSLSAPNNPSSTIHTPPASDKSSHSHKDEDAASSSDLSELDDEVEEDTAFGFNGPSPRDVPDPEIEPDRYEGGIPIFTPTMEQFKDFQKYVKGVDPYGMKSGIVLIDPPEEWKQARKPLDEMIKTIKVKNPITQEFHGAQGIYTQRNMEKMRSYNLPQWKALCESTENQPPAKRGERRLNADKLLGRGAPRRKAAPQSAPLPDAPKRKAGRPKVKPVTDEHGEADESNVIAPPTPTSPEIKPVIPVKAVKAEIEQTPEATPTKAKARPSKGGRQPGRQPKSASKRGDDKGKNTSVAARRLHNAQEAVNEIDEEAFENFDYRVDTDEWTAERCSELEDKYWKSLSFSNPMYGADMPGSLFDEDTKDWNVAKLPNLLDLIGRPLPGVNTAYLYLGMWRATFAWHLEDVDLYSINYIHFGAPKQWYSISQADAPKFETAMKSIWGDDAKNCDQFLRHKTYLVSPSLLKSKYGVTVNKVVHREGQFVITFPIGYHSGYNLGYNCAESVNFAIENWLPFGKVAKRCYCEDDSVFIDVDWFVRKLNGEPTPEFEEIEVTDDEEDAYEGPVDLPTPPESDRGQAKVSSKRKRAPAKEEPKKKRKIKIKISRKTPCCLCPNDFMCDELLPTDAGDGKKAHRRCALYTPETYIALEHGKEKVFNIAAIPKDRLELKCNECRQKKGSCFQCSSAKCTRAYHATCAAQAGVQVDIGEIAVWHEGVEYRDIGLDWRCKLHRTVKKTRPSSNIAEGNNTAREVMSEEFRNYLVNLKKNDLVQFQQSYLDDIEAGVVVREYDNAESMILLKVLPDLKRCVPVSSAWILYVDDSTSCLQKPSSNAQDLPEHLKGQTASLQESSDRKPSPGDVFAETKEKKYEWADFSSAVPPFNREQKQVDFSKEKQLWHYLGSISTESKALYTANPANHIHDPQSNFLQSIEPPKPLVAPVPPPQKRQSLAATFPGTAKPVNMAARNAAMVNARGNAPERKHSTNLAISSPSLDGAAREGDPTAQRQKSLGAHLIQPPNHYNGDFAPSLPYQALYRSADAARADHKRKLLERSQQKAELLDSQDKPYVYKPKITMSVPDIGVDLQAVERQRHFQRQGAQQSRDSCHPFEISGMQMLSQTLPTPYTQFSLYGTNNAQRRPSSASDSHTGVPSPSHSRSPIVSYADGSFPGPSRSLQAMNQSPSFSPRQYPLDQKEGLHEPAALVDRMDPVGAYEERQRFRDEKERIEPNRASANGTLFEVRQRRSSSTTNPGYPFKPVEELQAQRQRDLEQHQQTQSSAQRRTSQPPTSFLKQERQSSYLYNFPISSQQHEPSMDHPHPAFIDPTLTQFSPTPPHTSVTYQRSSLTDLHRLTSETRIAPNPYFPHSIASAAAKAKTDPTQSSRSQYLNAVLPKATSDDPGGNGSPIPPAYLTWKTQGESMAQLAQYFIHAHQKRSSVYRSPYAADGGFTDYGYELLEQQQKTAKRLSGEGLAGRFYEGLSVAGKAAVDGAREERRSFGAETG